MPQTPTRTGGVPHASATNPTGIALHSDRPDDDLTAAGGWDRPPAVTWVTRILLALLLVVVGFGAGALVQKSRTGSSGAGRPAAGAMPGGGSMPGGAMPGGVVPGGVMPGGGTLPRRGSAAVTPSAAAANEATSAGPVAIGTVTTVGDHTITLRNMAGVATVVSVPDTATVTTKGLHALAVGATVSVSGSTTGGRVTATAVVVR